jgi:DNA-directed RNA polymerase sigma subunit (sigma70/sigma32)
MHAQASLKDSHEDVNPMDLGVVAEAEDNTEFEDAVAANSDAERDYGDATDTYLGEIGRAKLLTADEEKSLAHKVQKGDMRARGHR